MAFFDGRRCGDLAVLLLPTISMCSSQALANIVLVLFFFFSCMTLK